MGHFWSLTLLAAAHCLVQHEAQADESACALLSSCLSTAGALYAQCDKALDDEPPACWEASRPAVRDLRLAVDQHYERLGRCLDAADDERDDATLALMNKDGADRCELMLRHYASAARTWDTPKNRRHKRAAANPDAGRKPHLAFYNCIGDAQRRAHMCNSLAQCCAKQKRCDWDERLNEKYAAEIKLKLAVLDRTQTCLKQMSKEGDVESKDIIDFLKPQNFWED